MMLKTASIRAFSHEHELRPYQELLADTTALLNPLPLQRWLDLGCGSGQLSKALWMKSKGRLAEVVGMDCAAVNEADYEKLRGKLQPRASKDRLRFVADDFSHGLSRWSDSYFDGVVSGPALWMTKAYDRILAEVFRVLRPGAQFVFSVNVPDPSWGKVTRSALSGAFQAKRPLHSLKRAWRIWSYGSWLKRESRRGRFHYLPSEVILQTLVRIGFVDIEQRTSFAGQAYIFNCRRSFAATLAA